ncbi:MAG: trimethylamine methyltransferase family protein [Desulfobacterales bacterium]|nr:trimethylamine methyltransferase family protein [Desulfobacterales bacterium]
MEDTLERLHQASVTILEETGIKIHHPRVLEILKTHGVKLDGDIAFFNEGLLMEWVKKAPEQFTIYARNPAHDMSLGSGQTWYGSGYGCPAIIEADGTRRSALFEDYKTFLKLVHQCDSFHLNGGAVVQPSDLDPSTCFPLMFDAVIRHSDKCLMGFPGSGSQVKDIMDLASAVFGGKAALKEKPRVITLVNTTSPLQLDDIALSTILTCAENGQPVIISPGPIAGATGPITPAGNIALGNAELLAGIAISQMIKPGTPVVYGLQATTADMKTGGISIGSPGFSIEAAWGIRLAKMYNIPCRAGGASSDAKGVSVQSGYESMMAMFVSRQEQADISLHSAGILDAYGAMSYEQFIVDTEIISMVEYYLKGMEVSDETLALEHIHSAGPGGQFLSVPHTFKHCRTVPWQPEVTHRGNLTTADAQEEIMENIKIKKRALLEAYQAPALEKEVDTALKNCLSQILSR